MTRTFIEQFRARLNRPGSADATAIGTIVLFSVICYGRVLQADFVNLDDFKFIHNNPHVVRGLSFDSIRWALSINYDYEPYLKPVTWLSHMLDVELFGLNATGHHLTNLIFHVCNAILIYFFLSLTTGERSKSVVAAILFSIHPLNVESVAWISQRKDVLSCFFLFISLIFYTLYVTKKRLIYIILSYLFFIVGLMSKPMIVMFPVVLIIIDYWPLRRLENIDITNFNKYILKSAVEKIPFIILSVAVSISTYISEQKHDIIYDSVSIFDRLIKSLSAYVDYLIKLAYPVNLAFYYPLAPTSPQKAILAAAVIVAITALAIVYRRQHPYLFAGWFWFVISIAPVIGYIKTGTHLADRYGYIPHIGLFIATTWGIFALIPLSRNRNVLFLAMFAALGTTCWIQTGYWHDSKTLFTHAMAVTEQNWKAHSLYATTLAEEGSHLAALEHFEIATAINHEDFTNRFNHASTLTQLGIMAAEAQRYTPAIEYFKKSLTVDSNLPDTHYYLGNAYLALGAYDQAIGSYLTTLAKNPKYLAANFNLGISYTRTGQFVAAAQQFDRYLEIFPDDQEAHYYSASCQLALGDRDQFARHYDWLLYNSPEQAAQLTRSGASARPLPAKN